MPSSNQLCDFMHDLKRGNIKHALKAAQNLAQKQEGQDFSPALSALLSKNANDLTADEQQELFNILTLIYNKKLARLEKKYLDLSQALDEQEHNLRWRKEQLISLPMSENEQKKRALQKEIEIIEPITITLNKQLTAFEKKDKNKIEVLRNQIRVLEDAKCLLHINIPSEYDIRCNKRKVSGDWNLAFKQIFQQLLDRGHPYNFIRALYNVTKSKKHTEDTAILDVKLRKIFNIPEGERLDQPSRKTDIDNNPPVDDYLFKASSYRWKIAFLLLFSLDFKWLLKNDIMNKELMKAVNHKSHRVIFSDAGRQFFMRIGAIATYDERIGALDNFIVGLKSSKITATEADQLIETINNYPNCSDENLSELLAACKKTGSKSKSKQEAYDIFEDGSHTTEAPSESINLSTPSTKPRGLTLFSKQWEPLGSQAPDLDEQQEFDDMWEEISKEAYRR